MNPKDLSQFWMQWIFYLFFLLSKVCIIVICSILVYRMWRLPATNLWGDTQRQKREFFIRASKTVLYSVWTLSLISVTCWSIASSSPLFITGKKASTKNIHSYISWSVFDSSPFDRSLIFFGVIWIPLKGCTILAHVLSHKVLGFMFYTLTAL